MIYSNIDFLEAVERHQGVKPQKDINSDLKAEILARHELSSNRYNRSGMEQRKHMRASAMCLKLTRWIK